MLTKQRQEELVRIAMEETALAIARGDEPFGGVLADAQGSILVREGNREVTEQDPTAHAEMALIRKACKKLGTNDLSGYVLVCNAESCSMCASALIKAGVREFYYGAEMEEFCDPFLRLTQVAAAAKQPIRLYGGILKEACRAQIAAARQQKNMK